MLAALLPGLGHVVSRRPVHGLVIFSLTGVLIASGLALGRTAGLSAEIFYFVLLVLPWWLLQVYDTTVSHSDKGVPLATALREVRDHAHDIRYLGILFLVTALMDLYIILANPDYALAIFCSKPTGALGLMVKIQSPTIHVLIGAGFLRLRRWALGLYLAYAGFGLLNATANFACFGFGRVRTVFLVSLLAFTAYIWSRRRHFA
ncbi:hypothetical protein YTPLAS18_16310 [Nitrospira sp.]|nr:hypothetical protein YTPLAS18_16310 [Nitrospira sp.]